MFRNGPKMDGGDTAYLGPTTIIEMTIPMSQSSSDATLDDSWVLAGPIRNYYLKHLKRSLNKNLQTKRRGYLALNEEDKGRKETPRQSAG